jgi:hypothetical protein
VSNRPLQYYHLENPTSTPWSTIAEGISEYHNVNLPQISLREWISKVNEYGIENVERIPAIRLTDFFEKLEGTSGLNVRNTLEVAPEVDYGPITKKGITRYLDYQGIEI